MVNIFDIFNSQGELSTILVYPAITLVDDPYEKTTSTSYLNPLPIKGIVSEITFGGLKYKYYGQLPTGSKHVICELRYKQTLLAASKVTIDAQEYSAYKDADGAFQVKEHSDYLVVILRKK